MQVEHPKIEEEKKIASKDEIINPLNSDDRFIETIIKKNNSKNVQFTNH